MNAVTLPRLGRTADVAPLVLRLGVGAIFAWHGWLKFTGGPANFGAEMLAGLNVPSPVVIAWLMTIAEGVGGLLLIAGVLTRLVTLPLIAIMVGALWLVKIDIGFVAAAEAPMPGAEFEVALLAGLVALLFLGPGRVSVDGIIGYEHRVATVRSLRVPEPTATE